MAETPKPATPNVAAEEATALAQATTLARANIELGKYKATEKLRDVEFARLVKERHKNPDGTALSVEDFRLKKAKLSMQIREIEAGKAS